MIKNCYIEFGEKELINMGLLLAEQYMQEVSRISRNLGNLEEATQCEERAKQFRALADKRIHDYKAT